MRNFSTTSITAEDQPDFLNVSTNVTSRLNQRYTPLPYVMLATLLFPILLTAGSSLYKKIDLDYATTSEISNLYRNLEKQQGKDRYSFISGKGLDEDDVLYDDLFS